MSHYINKKLSFYYVMVVRMFLAWEALDFLWVFIQDCAYFLLLYANVRSLENYQMISAYFGLLFGLIDLWLKIGSFLWGCEYPLIIWKDLTIYRFKAQAISNQFMLLQL